MRNIRVHPLFIVMLLLLLLTGKMAVAIYTAIALLIHEYAHYKVALTRGYKLTQLTLMPYGLLLYTEENLHPQDAFYIASAGIVANLCVCILLTASWWAVPSSYPYTQPLFEANFVLAIFNLLPAYPLDGARIVLAISKKPLKMLVRLKRLGVIFSFLLLVSFIASAFYQINFSLAIASVSLYVGARFGTKHQAYLFIAEQYPFEKNKRHPVEQVIIYADIDMEIKKIYPYFNKNKLLLIKITDNGGTIAELSENEFLARLSGHASNDRIGSLISGYS